MNPLLIPILNHLTTKFPLEYQIPDHTGITNPYTGLYHKQTDKLIATLRIIQDTKLILIDTLPIKIDLTHPKAINKLDTAIRKAIKSNQTPPLGQQTRKDKKK